MAKRYNKPSATPQQSGPQTALLPHNVTLSNGVVLEVHKVPTAIMMDKIAELRAAQPKVPVVYIERLDREEENPDDPDYQKAMTIFVANQAKSMNDAMLFYGTKFVRVPKNIPVPNDEKWLDGVDMIYPDIINAGERKRYMYWLKTVALTNDEDITMLMREIGRMSGVTEADVAAASGSFPGNEGRPADNGVQEQR